MFANRRAPIRSIASIRTRLLIAFMLSVLFPVSMIGIVLGISTTQSNRLSLGERFQTVAASKEAEINGWLASLETAGGALLAGQQEASWAATLLQSEASSPEAQEALAGLGKYLRPALTRTRLSEIILLSLQGKVLYSTNPAHIGQNHASQEYFIQGLKNTYIGPLTWDTLSHQGYIMMGRPLKNETGQVMGVLGYLPTIEPLNNILTAPTGMGGNEKSYLINAQGQLLTASRGGSGGETLDNPLVKLILEKAAQPLSEPASTGFNADLLSAQNALGVPAYGIYRKLAPLGAILVVEQPSQESNAVNAAALAVNASLGISAVLIAIVVSLLATRSVTVPIIDLAETAAQIAQGNFKATRHTEREDEIGELAQVFNNMATQLHQTMERLEQQVAARTMDLELRSAYLQASAEVSQIIASILDPNKLIREVVELIQERFNLYYVGLFLVNERGDWAILKSGTGEAGKAMMNRGHRIAVGRGMIGWSIANATPRIALQAGEDAVRLVIPELPETRSEAALPLRIRDRVLGAISIQSVVPNAFNKDNIAILQIIADQVGIALENARLYSESQAALEATRRSFGEASQAAWAELFGARPDIGYRSDEFGAITIDRQWRPEMLQAISTNRAVVESDLQASERKALSVPIKVRENVIGALYTYKTGEYATWNNDETTLLQTISEQIGVALESAQLFQDTRQRASREELIGQITARIRESLHLETVLQTAVAEIGQSLGLHDLTIHLEADTFAPAEGDKESAA